MPAALDRFGEGVGHCSGVEAMSWRGLGVCEDALKLLPVKVHLRGTVFSNGQKRVVRSAHQSAVSDVGSATLGKRNPVIDLNPVTAQAPAAGLWISVLALSLIPEPDGTSNGCRNEASRLNLRARG